MEKTTPAQSSPDGQKDPNRKTPQNSFLQSFLGFENLRSLSILLVIILAFRWSVASPYHVPTASMEPTIKVGDRLLAYKLAYNIKVPFTDMVIAEWSQPKRGDIIVFRYPKEPDIDYVKRVVGLAGDKIEVKDDILYINGQPQPRHTYDQDRAVLEDAEDDPDGKLLFKENLEGLEHWTMQKKPELRHFGVHNFPPDGSEYRVPENALFVMGDNRDNSQDSRIWHHVPMSYVRGKAVFVIWSVYSPPQVTWPRLRLNRFGHMLH